VRKEEEVLDGVEKEGTKCNIKGNLLPSKEGDSFEAPKASTRVFVC